MRLAVLLACVFVTLPGCGGGGSTAVPAGGTVTVKGQPAGGALVVFHPKAPGGDTGPKPVATTSPDGTFTLTTSASGDGAPPGDYGVTVVWPGKGKDAKLALGSEGSAAPDQLGGRYGDPRAPKLTATVTAGGPNRFTFELP